MSAIGRHVGGSGSSSECRGLDADTAFAWARAMVMLHRSDACKTVEPMRGEVKQYIVSSRTSKASALHGFYLLFLLMMIHDLLI